MCPLYKENNVVLGNIPIRGTLVYQIGKSSFSESSGRGLSKQNRVQCLMWFSVHKSISSWLWYIEGGSLSWFRHLFSLGTDFSRIFKTGRKDIACEYHGRALKCTTSIVHLWACLLTSSMSRQVFCFTSFTYHIFHRALQYGYLTISQNWTFQLT